jgi:hypothetical protein
MCPKNKELIMKYRQVRHCSFVVCAGILLWGCQSSLTGEILLDISSPEETRSTGPPDMEENIEEMEEEDLFQGEIEPISYPIHEDCDDGNACTEGSYDLKSNTCSYEPVNCDDEDSNTDDWCDPDVGCINWSQTCVQDVHYELWTDMVSGPKIKGDIPDVSLGCCDSDLDCTGSPWGDQCAQESMPMVGFGLHGSGKYGGLCHECEDNCDCPFGKECVLELQDLLTQDELDAHHDELGQDFIGAPRRPVLRCQ